MSSNNIISNVVYKNNEELRNATNSINSYLLLCKDARCTKHYTKSSTIWFKDKDYDWLLRLKCTKCFQEWAVCSKCNHCTTQMASKRQINMHKNTYHNSNEAKYSKKRKNNILDDIDAYLESKKIKGIDVTTESNNDVTNDINSLLDNNNDDNPENDSNLECYIDDTTENNTYVESLNGIKTCLHEDPYEESNNEIRISSQEDTNEHEYMNDLLDAAVIMNGFLKNINEPNKNDNDNQNTQPIPLDVDQINNNDGK
jgi:hypothetical protein